MRAIAGAAAAAAAQLPPRLPSSSPNASPTYFTPSTIVIHSSSSSSSSSSSAAAASSSSGNTRRIAFTYSTLAMSSAPSSLTDCSAAEDESDRTLILKPLKGKEGDDVLLVFCPGALTPAEDYLPIMSLTQSVSNLRLWIAILNPITNCVITSMIVASFDGIISRIKELGYSAGELPSSNIFIAGHSLGAWNARSVAFKFSEGFIQMGSCFPNNLDNLAQYPKPVLTLSGALDGQITLGAIAKHAGEIFDTESEMGEINTIALKPVIIIPGMNHAQFSHGHPNKERGDMDPDISLDLARSLISKNISAFLTVHAASPESESKNEAFQKLRESVSLTHTLYHTFWEAIKNQISEAKEWQLTVAAYAELKEADIAVTQHQFLDNFVYSKPWIDSKNRKIYIHCYLNPIHKKFETVSNLWIKMKSSTAIRSELKLGSTSDEDPTVSKPTNTSAAELNEKTFSRALCLVHDSSREKYVNCGKKVRFVDDLIITSSGQDWVDSDVIFRAAADGCGLTDVESPVVMTPTEGIAARFAGMHYMKLLTIARAMQWILVDAFRM